MQATTTCRHSALALRAIRLLAIAIIIIFACLLLGCAGVGVEVRKDTDFGTATLRASQDGATLGIDISK